MAPPPSTEDFYAILEVDQTATSEQINHSYKRLALIRHPDKGGKKEDFQLLKLAHDTLISKDQRYEYDRFYPSLLRNRSFSQDTPTSKPSAQNSSRTPQSSTTGLWQAMGSQGLRQLFREFMHDAEGERRILRAKGQRTAEWELSKHSFEASIAELRKQNCQLAQEIEVLRSVVDGSSEGSWLASLGYTNFSERKEQERHSAKLEKLKKEKEFVSRQARLYKEERALERAWEEFDGAELCVDAAIRSYSILQNGRKSVLSGYDDGWDREMRKQEEQTRRQQKEQEQRAAQAQKHRNQEKAERQKHTYCR